MTPDIHTLTGAYAADALSDDERRSFEAHLDECDACAQEVAELQATAAMLGAASFEPPPPSLRDAVLAEIDQVRQEPPAVPSADERPAARSRPAVRPPGRCDGGPPTWRCPRPRSW
jgi:anti-sigma factor RsiW